MKDLHTIDTYPLFELIKQEHSIILTEGELYDIISVVIEQADKRAAHTPDGQRIEQICIGCKNMPATCGIGRHKLVCSDCWNKLADRGQHETEPQHNELPSPPPRQAAALQEAHGGSDALLPGVVAFSLDNGRTEGAEFVIGDITVTVARQAVSTEAERYVVTIQEDGMGEGVEIGTVAEARDALPMVRAIAQIIENE